MISNDFPCLCGHLAKDHDFDQKEFKTIACLKRDFKRVHYPIYGDPRRIELFADDCGQFEPISNLEYLERLINADS